MDVLAAIAGRRSTREFTSQAIDPASVRCLIDAAALAPSAVNQQPCTFTVVENQELLTRISGEAKAYMSATLGAEASHGSRLAQMRARLADPGFQIFYHAPVLILICANAPGEWITEDCALAAENLMLAAHSMGLGSCWIGFAQQYLNTAAGRRHLGLPESWVPVAPIILGYARSPPAPVPRRQPEIRWIG